MIIIIFLFIGYFIQNTKLLKLKLYSNGFSKYPYLKQVLVQRPKVLKFKNVLRVLSTSNTLYKYYFTTQDAVQRTRSEMSRRFFFEPIIQRVEERPVQTGRTKVQEPRGHVNVHVKSVHLRTMKEYHKISKGLL